MGIGSRRALTSAATAALLLCCAAAGTAAAEEAPVDDRAVSADQTTEINDRQRWEDETDQPLQESEPRVCSGSQTWYEFSSKKAYHVPSWWNGTKYKDGPGGTMSVSVTKSGTITLEVSGSGEWSAGAILAKAKTTISVKVAGSVSVTTGHTYSHDIGRNKYGHLQYGSWGYKVNWKRYQSVGSGCGAPREIGHGTAILPTKETGWKYWETKS
ncbi:hypothetical protein [Streptomyces cellostaticus]|uniref:hypothetical protein n=1 Tax=Streptomyces cellostaticus TaxID=67285 RepID=UPI002026CFC1|nr:hypothetical protein [Streptomyces cellostaticus]